MTPERWKQVCAVFSAVLDQESRNQARYLDEMTKGDPQLHAEVAQLVRVAEEADRQGFLNAPAWIVDDIPLFLPDFRNGGSEYSKIEYIGHGGMGVVYKSFHSNLDRWVALKLCSPTHLVTRGDLGRFRGEAQNMARLRHPNIVTVHETGEYQGRPYFVMELIEGKPLEKRLSEFAERPRDAAGLVETVALAVHHAHQRRILHNDLKPANILLDEAGTPHITDFGLAKRLEEDSVILASGAVEGTASYMSPEQAEGKEITTASDVYGLGAILFALLTGRPPFRGETVQGTLQLVRNESPRPPSRLNPKVDKTLEAICLKCLEKDKDRRYASANGLAQDLARCQAGKETRALPWSRHERAVSWCRRNIVEASLSAAVVAIWIFAVVMALSVAQARKAHLLEATLDGVSFAATDLATTALLQLRSLINTAEGATAGSTLAGLLAKDDRNGLQQYLGEICKGGPSPFASCFVMNADGIIVARVRPGHPDADDLTEDALSWRDYFQGAKRKGKHEGKRSVHISRVYRGLSDNLYKFAISAPILDKEKFLGVIATSVTTDATMGLVYLHDETRQVALIAPRDVDTSEPSREGRLNKYVVLFHPAYRQGVQAVGFPDMNWIGRMSELANNQQLQLPNPKLVIPPDHNYRDPVSSVAKNYEGRWIAGFAPVGNTGFVVVVQQRFEEAVSLEASTFWNLALWSALVSCVAVAILVMILWRWAHRRGLAAA